MRKALLIVVLAGLLVGLQQSLAWAAWSAPLAEWSILAPYGASCPSGTHRGVDLSGQAGDTVSSPAGGTVAFAGRVPADGGGTCGAVTIETTDGLRISLMPLEELSVSAGSAVAAGDGIGTLAAAGDGSSPEPHLHLGLRRGEAYLDPTSLLRAVPAQPPAPEPAAASNAVSPASSSAAPLASTPAAQTAAPDAPVQAVAVSASTQQPAANRSASHGRQLLVDAGVPQPSALRPELRPAERHIILSATHVTAQQGVSVVLLLGMAGAVAGIAAPRLAAIRSR